MVATVIGKKKGSFTDDKSGKNINYAKVNCLYDFDTNTQRDVSGQEMGCFGCTEDSVFNSLVVGMKYNLFFNQKGKIEMFKEVK